MKLKTFFSKQENTCNSSKASFFNKTLFFKNVTLFWPLWAAYTLALFIALPISLWLNNSYDGFMYTQSPEQDRLYDLLCVLEIAPYLTIITIASILFGMAIFHYMYNAKSANMVHSLPVDRRQLFGTNLISGWAFLIIPQIVTAVFALIICASYGVPKSYCVLNWLLVVMAIAIVIYSVVTICAMLTGLLLALPLYVVIALNFFYWIWAIYTYILMNYGFGIDLYYGYDDKMSIVNLLSPFYAFQQNVAIDKVNLGTPAYPMWEPEVTGVPVLLIYLAVAVVLYFIAYKIYKKRQIEQAGDLLTVAKLKPVFRWGVGTSGGVFIGLFVKAVLEETGINLNLLVTVILILLFGGLCYFFAEMFIKKSFRVFKKKNRIGCAKFTVILLASFFVCFGIAKYEENYVPALDDIESVNLYSAYDIKFYGEDRAFVTDIHKRILDNKALLDVEVRNPDISYANIRITYELKNGRVISRRYLLPMEGEMEQILFDIVKKENSPETFINSYLKYHEFQAWDNFDGEVTYERLDDKDIVHWENKYLSETLVRKFYEAAVKDAKAGTLIKYNRNQYYDYYYGKYGYNDVAIPEMDAYVPSIASLSIYFREGEDYYHRDSIHISFGPDCENLVQLLIDCGFVESVDEILWQ